MKGKRFPFIAIEGIDGVGKTTCTELLASEMSAILYKTPSGVFEKIRKEIEDFGNNQVRFTFYLTSVFYASNEISKLVSQKPVICDRYIYSTIAYHRGLKVDLSHIDFERLPIVFPDFCFYLYATENVCKQRITSRKQGISSASDIALENDKNLQRRIHQEFLKLPMISIDTSELTVNEVCEQILLQI